MIEFLPKFERQLLDTLRKGANFQKAFFLLELDSYVIPEKEPNLEKTFYNNFGGFKRKNVYNSNWVYKKKELDFAHLKGNTQI